MKRFLLLSLVIILAASMILTGVSCGKTTSADGTTQGQIPEGWNKYTGSTSELYLPGNWKGGGKEEFDSLIENIKQAGQTQLASQLESVKSYLIFYAYDTETADSAEGFTNFNIVSESAPSYSLDEYMDLSYKNAADAYKQAGYEFSIIEQKVISLGNNKEVGKTIVEQTIAGVKSRAAQYMIKHDSDFWILTFSTEPAKFDQNIQTFDKIVGTFTIK